jgi:hypothetical protein
VNPQSKLFREDLKQFSYQLFVINLDVAQSVHGRWPEILDAQWLDRNQLTTSNASSDILNAMIDL